ncbi:secretin N-terminal domain-containing protein [Candidatus Poribacteria bacterium]
MSFRFGNVNYRFKGIGRKAKSKEQGAQDFMLYALCSVLVALFAFFSFTNVAFAQQGGKLGEDKVKVIERDEEGKAEKLSFFNVVNVDIHDILKFMSDETNLTIIASEKVQGKVTLVNLKDITVEESLEALKTALNTLGFTTVRVNNTTVIVSLEDARTRPVKVQVGSDPDEIESSDEMITQIMPLSYADAAEMAQNLKNLIPKSGDMFADTNNNSLIITDTSSNIRRIAMIMKQLDTEPGEVLTTRVFQLEHAEAMSLEQTLNDLFRQGVEMARGLQRMSSRGTEEMMRRLKDAQRDGRMPGRGIDFVKGLVFISADERTNKLIVTASEENIVSIEKMITELDTSDVAQSEIKVFPLAYAVAEDVAESLESLLEGDSSVGSRRGRDRRSSRDRWRGDRRGGEGSLKGIQGQVNIVSDDRLNAVVVVSDPQNFSLIENIIDQLDQQIDPQEVIKIIPLEYADAETTVQSMEDLFQGGSNADLPWWERERRRREGRGDSEEITGIQGEVNMVADVRLNSIVVSTASANIPIIMDLVKQLDKTVPDLESSTKVIQLKNADAENLADILNNIYQSGGGSQGRSRFSWMPQRSSRSSQRSTITGTVTVSAYPRNNSLIVTSSSARNFDIIESLINELDQPTEADFKYSTLIYPLEYSQADEMEELLNDIFSEDGGSSSRQRMNRSFFRMMSGGSATMLKDMTTLAGQVRVNADEQTNTLVFTTPERNFEAIRDMVKKLDIVRGQVWLDITILEVLLSDDTKLGVEWGWQEENHLGRDGLTGEFGTVFNLSTEGLGFTYKVFDNNLTAMLHALTRENRVRVITNTSLPTRDNNTARLSKGRDIPYLESQRTDNFGNILFDYSFLQDIGITLEITPHIAKAGLRESKELLFNVGMGFQEDLDAGNISDDLRKEFGSNGIPLSDTATALVEVVGYRWLIDDGDGIYIIIRGRDKLSVNLKKEERRTVGLDIATMNVSNFVEFTEFNAPITDDSNITTYVDVEDGERIVIGGVMKTEDKLVTSQIPILGSIPFLGRLFKKTETVAENSELLILITPHIIDINRAEDRDTLMDLQNQLRSNGSGMEEDMEKQPAE